MAGIYLHIPFCRQACNYCNFHFSTNLRSKEDLVSALVQEAGLQRAYLEGETIETVYFGGGTPSLLATAELMRVWDSLEKNFPKQALQEVTLEANPDDLTPAYLRELSHTPVNRLSIGIQSFQDKDLQYMNRAHNARQADYAVKLAQDKGFTNISVDLIYGTPTMSDAEWRQNINQAIALQVPHISCYALTVEARTALAHAIARGQSREPDEAQTATQFRQLTEALAAAGFEHYEISNFALPGKYARHNTNYWRGHHYLGLGPSAHSFNTESRQWNVANNALYIQSVLGGLQVPYEREHLSFEDRHNEYIMTALRTMWGVSLEHVSTHFGGALRSRLEQAAVLYQENNWMTYREDHLVLTPEGKLLADRIASELFL